MIDLRAAFGRKCSPHRGCDDGFTLIELLVVLAILGLLAAIATPRVLHYLSSAKTTTATVQVESLSSALDLFKFDVGRYPTTQEGLAALLTDPGGVAHWHGPYIKSRSSLDDPWGHPYVYRSPGEKGDFDLFSLGQDNKEDSGAETGAVTSR